MPKYARGKVQFKEILSERFDKPFENISENDLRQDLITSGRTRADIRDVLQGFRKFKRKDADFTLDEDGGYRINTTQGALKNSGRKKGRKVGQSDLARLLRLGEDVSKFAGYTQNVAEQINIPKVIEAPVEEEIDPELDFSNIFEGIDPLAQGKSRKEPPEPNDGTFKSNNKTSKSKDGTSKSKDETNVEFNENESYFDEEFFNNPIGKPLRDVGEFIGADNIGRRIDRKLYDILYGNSDRSYEEFKKQEEENKKTSEELGLDYVIAPEVFTPVGIAGPGSYIQQLSRLYKPGVSFLKTAKNISKEGLRRIRNLLDVKSAKTLKALQRAAKVEKAGFKGIMNKSINAVDDVASEAIDLTKGLKPAPPPAPTSAVSTVTRTAKQFPGQTADYNKMQNFAESLRRNNQTMGIMPDGTRIKVSGTAFQVFKKGGKIQGAESGMESKIGPLETPYAAIDHNLGRFIWQDQKEDSPLMFDGTYFTAKEGEPYPVKSMKTIDDISELSKMKKGGKIIKANLGLKLTPFNEQAYNAKKFGNSGLYNNINTDIPFFSSNTEKGDSYATSDAKEGDSYEVTGIDDKQGLNLNDLLYYGATVGLPFGKAIQSTIMMNRLKDKLVPDLQSPDLNVGVVRDIRRPEQSIKYNPTTADVGAENANRQFQLAQNRSQRFAFDAGQDESKIRQEEAVRENQNRQKMMDAEIANKKKGIASQLAAQRYFTELGQRNQAVIGGAETLADIGMQNQYVRSMKQMELAKAMMRKGNIEGAKKILGIRKNGGRLTKFSKNASK
jgi:hypothetical protein